MGKVLCLTDFTWIVINPEEQDGYYSFKENGWEVCLDYTIRFGWTISLSNSFEEVLEEQTCKTEQEALQIANGLYQKFTIQQ